jgi:hypothetical protein
MNALATPWVAFTVLALLLVSLFLREILIARRMPEVHPERRMAYFNACVLALLLVAVLYGERVLVVHDAELTASFPRYPTARFAPERQLLGEGDWVYVTSDAPANVVDFYVHDAGKSDYRVIAPSGTSSEHVFLSSPQRELFLTVRREGDLTVLYFTASGTLSSYEVSGR